MQMHVKKTGIVILQSVGVVMGVLGTIIIFPFLLPLILALMFISRIQTRQFRRRYATFLVQNEGAEFFCYTNRANSQLFVKEHILPALDPQVHIIHLQGNKPISSFDEVYISHMLHSIEQVGFPSVMKIVNGRVFDRSLHHELYTIVNQKQSPTLFVETMEEQLTQLRGLKEESS